MEGAGDGKIEAEIRRLKIDFFVFIHQWLNKFS